MRSGNVLFVTFVVMTVNKLRAVVTRLNDLVGYDIILTAFSVIILLPIALFASLSQSGLGTRNEGAMAAPAKRSEKGYEDENAIRPLSTPVE